jgi:hypothetical protein
MLWSNFAAMIALFAPPIISIERYDRKPPRYGCSEIGLFVSGQPNVTAQRYAADQQI